MLEVASRSLSAHHHPHHRSSPSSSTSSSPSPHSNTSSSTQSRPTLADPSPLPVRPLRAPPSPLVDQPSPSPLQGLESSSMNGDKSNVQPHLHRIRKGQRIEDIHPPVPSVLPPLHYIDSPFQLQEYLSLLIRQDPHNVERIVALPQPSSEVTRTFAEEQPAALQKGKGKDESAFAPEEEPQSVDTDVWVYEQLRRIVLDFTTPWLTSLQKECDRKTRPKTCDAMNADDWMYLCASHGEEKQCCAIDYIVHTLDGTTALLNSARHFPSRTYIPTTSLRHFGSVSRRLSRIFVHAYEHHSDVFEACENETSLYARFLALVQTYDLIAVDSLPLLGAKARPAISAKEQEEESIGRNVSAEEKSEVPKKILLRSSTNDADNLNRSASNASTRTAVRIGTQEDQSGALDRRDLSPDEAPADAKDIDDEDEL